MLETGQKHINFRFVNMGGSKYLYSKSMWFYSLNIKPEGRILPYFFIYFFFLIDKFVPSVHSLQEIATRANTNPEAK